MANAYVPQQTRTTQSLLYGKAIRPEQQENIKHVHMHAQLSTSFQGASPRTLGKELEVIADLTIQSILLVRTYTRHSKLNLHKKTCSMSMATTRRELKKKTLLLYHESRLLDDQRPE